MFGENCVVKEETIDEGQGKAPLHSPIILSADMHGSIVTLNGQLARISKMTKTKMVYLHHGTSFTKDLYTEREIDVLWAPHQKTIY